MTGTITYTNSNGLANNQAVSCTFTAKVTKLQKTTDTLNNTVYIDQVVSKMNKDLYKENNPSNPTYHSIVGVKYQIYRGTINKYITKIDTASAGSRASLNNVDRNNKPVEVEKGNVVTYTIKFANTATGNANDNTSLYKLSFIDTSNGGTTLNKNVTVKLR